MEEIARTGNFVVMLSDMAGPMINGESARGMGRYNMVNPFRRFAYLIPYSWSALLRSANTKAVVSAKGLPRWNFLNSHYSGEIFHVHPTDHRQ